LGKKVFDENTLGSIYAYLPNYDFGAVRPEPTKIY
jgi:hypothetical protein